jgi:hypothetical protein
MAQAEKRKAGLVEGRGSMKRKATGTKPHSDAARRLASAIESHMTDLCLAEHEKDERVSRFGERVDRAISRRAKS